MEFEPLWQALYENGSSAKNKEATYRFWRGLSTEEQEAACTIIIQKVAQKSFVLYDPIRAIKEAIRKLKPAEPDFLSGAEQDRLRANGVAMVQVHYNGTYKICTRETAEAFGLTITKDPW